MIQIAIFDFNTRQEYPLAPTAWPERLPAGQYAWVDIRAADAPAEATFLKKLGLNERAIAETLGADQEGRFDIYPDCVHLGLTEAARCQDHLESAHVDLVLGAQFLITHHRRDMQLLRRMRQTYQEDFQKHSQTPGFLLYEIADSLYETFRHSLRAFSDAAETVQDQLMSRSDEEIFLKVSDLMRDLLVFRKAVLAGREILHELAARKSRFVSESTQPFLELTAGALERLGNDLLVERDVLNDSITLYMSMVGHRTNRIVKTLTIVSAVFMPLAFLCGVYGMNFEHMPELGWRFGYGAFWFGAFILVGGLLLFFKTRRWF